jgi:hypothetical protein
MAPRDTSRREWLDRPEEAWVRAFVLDGTPEAAARVRAAELMDAAEQATATGGKLFWDLATVLPMACADAEFGRRILEIFTPALEAGGEDEATLSADERADAAQSREELARQLATVRAAVERGRGLPESAG